LNVMQPVKSRIPRIYFPYRVSVSEERPFPPSRQSPALFFRQKLPHRNWEWSSA
jgi:hypothetical protein